MNKSKFSCIKLPLVKILSLSFIILGIGFTFCGAFSMWTLPDYSTTKKISAEIKKPIDNNSEDSSLALYDTEIILYPKYPSVGDTIGSLFIPSLKEELPIIQGTGDKELKKGVGHFAQSVLPGEKDNCVLSGHRETTFDQIGKLRAGDLLIVHTSAGTFTYEVKGSRIVDKDDKTVIVPTDHAVLTLTTCYPFNFIGSAPDRYIVSADLVVGK